MHYSPEPIPRTPVTYEHLNIYKGPKYISTRGTGAAGMGKRFLNA